ncbi:putative F-box protein [Corchorus capsularis]|uniref:Putative F-box protein n=1 Tax=Corchorus capsularis TaxID=210143 RepID=A0A1R3GPS9_COCAP|nr:putative F-box protein [Corchorus capsularis]
MKSVLPDWANIPCDVVCYIVGKIHPSMQDIVRMGAVCQSWQASIELEPKFPICLMLAEREDDNDMRRFLTASEDRVMELELSEIRGRRCWGTPFGWLASYSLDFEIRLFNPLSRASFSLPLISPDASTSFLELSFIFKLILSSSPISPNCIVEAIYGQTYSLAFVKPGDQQWTRIDSTRSISDVTYFDGNFYAVNRIGKVFRCELGLDEGSSAPKCVEFTDKPPQFNRTELNFIVDLGGHLCVIGCNYGEYQYIKEYGEVEMEYINADYPACTSNCIYFTDNQSEFYSTTKGDGVNTGIYNCANKEILRLPVGGR